MIRLWTRISKRSNVAVPSPHGDFRVVTFIRFVGRGIGPRMATPVLFAISAIIPIIELRALMSMLLNLIRTFPMGCFVENGF